MLADRLEHVLHRDRLAAEIAGKDRTAIDEDRRHVEPDHRHHHPRKRLVAAGETDQRIVGMAPDRQCDGIGDAFARWQRRAHAVMAHGDAVGHGDGAELARGASGGGTPLLDRLGLTHQRDVAGRGFIAGRRHTDERLMDLLGSQPHGIKRRAMGRPFRALRHVRARESLHDAVLGVHREPVSPANSCWTREMQDFPSPSRAPWPSAYEGMISWRGVAKKRRAQDLAGMTVKSSVSVASKQQSWRGGNHLLSCGRTPYPADVNPYSRGAMRPGL